MTVSGLPMELTHSYGARTLDDLLLGAYLVVSDVITLYLHGSAVSGVLGLWGRGRRRRSVCVFGGEGGGGSCP